MDQLEGRAVHFVAPINCFFSWNQYLSNSKPLLSKETSLWSASQSNPVWLYLRTRDHRSGSKRKWRLRHSFSPVKGQSPVSMFPICSSASDCWARPLDYFCPDALSSFQKRRNSSIIPSFIVDSMGWGGPNNVNTICLLGPLSEQTCRSLWARYTHYMGSQEGRRGRGQGRSSQRAALGAREPWPASGPSLGLHPTSMPLARA